MLAALEATNFIIVLLRALALIFSSLSVKRKRVHTMYTLDSMNIPTTVKRNISLYITEFSGSTSGVMG